MKNFMIFHCYKYKSINYNYYIFINNFSKWYGQIISNTTICDYYCCESNWSSTTVLSNDTTKVSLVLYKPIINARLTSIGIMNTFKSQIISNTLICDYCCYESATIIIIVDEKVMWYISSSTTVPSNDTDVKLYRIPASISLLMRSHVVYNQSVPQII